MKAFNTTITSYSDYASKLNVGDYILFQTFEKVYYGKGTVTISKPIFAIFLGGFQNEDLFGFNYVRWVNPKHKITFGGMKIGKEVTKIEYHIEYDGYVHIINSWSNKPNYKQILVHYRKAFKEGRV